jgi:thymidylate synthase
VIRSIYSSWIQLLDQLLTQGQEVKPRGLKCKELLGVQFCFDNAYANIIIDSQRKLNYKFMVAQWLSTLCGFDDKVLVQFNSKLSNYETDGRGGVYPSYGPRLVPQWPFVLKSLTDDRFSRQAVMSIWEAQVWNAGQERYVPCTLSLQFLLRPVEAIVERWALHTVVSMRSSDAWLGLPYDAYNFSMLANYLCSNLNQMLRAYIRLGSLTINLGSSHLYEEHWERARSIVNAPIGGMAWSPQLQPSLDLPKLYWNESEFMWYKPSDCWLAYADILKSTTNAEAMFKLCGIQKIPTS